MTISFTLYVVLQVEMNCQCSSIIGTNIEREFTAVRNNRFYLNTAHPASCSGTIDRWRYCYYRPASVEGGERYRVTWAIYQRMVSGNDIDYIMVDSSLHAVEVRSDRDPLNTNDGTDFWCFEESVNTIRIEIGNIVGACIYQPSRKNREQLDIVGRANGYTLMQMDGVGDCDRDSMPSSISSSQLTNGHSRILHLSDNITLGMFIYKKIPLIDNFNCTYIRSCHS